MLFYDRDWKPILIKHKKTGEERAIKDKYFDKFKDEYEFVKELPPKGATYKPTVIEIPNVAPKPVKIDSPKGRFESLKEKGWKNLDKAERAEYSKFKKELNK